MSIKSCSLRQSARGIALLIVLWMLALLSVIAGSLVFSSRTEILVADNITQPLDVTVAAQILRLLRDLQRDFGTSIVFALSKASMT